MIPCDPSKYDSAIVNMTINLMQLAHMQGSNHLEKIHFSECLFVGPTIVGFIGTNQFEGTHIFNPAHSVLVPHESQQGLIGVLTMKGCAFLNCKFEGVTILASMQEKADILAAHNEASKSKSMESAQVTPQTVH
jgi:hypothetical protein